MQSLIARRAARHSDLFSAAATSSGGGGGAWEQNLAGIGGGAWTLFRDGTMEGTTAGSIPGGGFGYFYNGRTVTDAAAPWGGGYMETVYAAGEIHSGDGGSVIESSGINAKEFYVCFNHQFSSNYRWHTLGEKLWFQQVTTGLTYNVLDIHYLTTTTGATCEIFGRRTTGGVFDPTFNAAVVPLTKGQWDTIEIYGKMNTGTANEDGILKVWINNTATINRTDWQYCSDGAGADAAYFGNFRWDGTCGGGLDGGGALPAEQTRRINRATCRYR